MRRYKLHATLSWARHEDKTTRFFIFLALLIILTLSVDTMKIPEAVQAKLTPWFTTEEMNGVRIVLVPLLPPMVNTINFRKVILIRRDKWNQETDGIARIGHEMVHVRQYRQMGTVPFLAQYCWDAIKMWRRPWDEWPLEIPAYKLQQEIRKALK